MKTREGGRSSQNPSHQSKYKSEIRAYKNKIARSNRERLLACAALVRAKKHYVAAGNSVSNFEEDAARDSGITSRMIRYHLSWGEIDPKARAILINTDAGARDLMLVRRAGSPARQRKAAIIYAQRGRITLEKWVFSALFERAKPKIDGAPLSILYAGDALDVLRTLPSKSVQCIVVSPPYWQLRDFLLGARQLGLEATVEEYVKNLVAILREARRVLNDDGVLWLNIGDTASSGEMTGAQGPGSTITCAAHNETKIPRRALPVGLGPKNLVGVPWKVAFALQADGWVLRADIIWEQTQKMPESVKDRPSRGHEHIFMLTKNPDYYFDKAALRGALEDGKMGTRDVWAFPSSDRRKGGRPHPAPFPVALPALCIAASTRPGDVVLDLFLGSGTTSVAALRAGCASIGIDANARYIKEAAKRIVLEGGRAEIKRIEVPERATVLELTERKAHEGRVHLTRASLRDLDGGGRPRAA